MSRFSTSDVKTAEVDGVTTATTVIAAAPAGFQHIVVGGFLSMATAGTVSISSDDDDDGSADEDWFSGLGLGAGVPLKLDVTPLGWFVAPAGHGLQVTASTACNGSLRYVTVRVHGS